MSERHSIFPARPRPAGGPEEQRVERAKNELIPLFFPRATARRGHRGSGCLPSASAVRWAVTIPSSNGPLPRILAVPIQINWSRSENACESTSPIGPAVRSRARLPGPAPGRLRARDCNFFASPPRQSRRLGEPWRLTQVSSALIMIFQSAMIRGFTLCRLS
jgi:hypothetical protein